MTVMERPPRDRMTNVRAEPLVPWGDMCAWCWGQKAIWEDGPLGLVPVMCGYCMGRGRL